MVLKYQLSLSRRANVVQDIGKKGGNYITKKQCKYSSYQKKRQTREEP